MTSSMPGLCRRSLLKRGVGLGLGMTAGVLEGAAGLLTLSELLGPAPAAAAPQQPAGPPIDPAEAATALPTRESGSFVSAARRGTPTNWIIARPPGQTGLLRPVIALHCLGENAEWVMSLGVEDELARLVRAGRPPFAVVAVDGGDTYWRRRASGQDSGAMVLTELLPMLATKGLDTSRVGFMGWSMGGYGALRLGSQLGPGRTAGICAISPALYLTYFEAPPEAFDGIDDFRTNSMINPARLASIPLRVDCGVGDRFYVATSQFVSQLRPRPAGGFYPGGHNIDFWRAHLPDELAWMVT